MPAPDPIPRVSTFRLRRRTPGCFCLVPFPRRGRSLRCQGQLEAAAATVLVACPLVDDICEQPLAIWYSWRETSDGPEIQLLSGKPSPDVRRHSQCSYIVPDFLVRMQSGRQHLVEVKPSTRLSGLEVERKLAVGRAYAVSQNWSYHVLTEKELFAGPLLPNIRVLRRYQQLEVDLQVVETIRMAVELGPQRLKELIPRVAVRLLSSDPRAVILHLISAGHLDIDPRLAPVSDETLVYPGGSIPWDPFVSVWGPSGSGTDGPSESFASSPPTNSLPKT